MNGLVSTTFTLEQKSVFKLERNKDLTFIVIIIDIDWYEKKYRDNFLGHIAQPYLNATSDAASVFPLHCKDEFCWYWFYLLGNSPNVLL